MIHGEPKGEMEEDGRNSPPPQGAMEDPALDTSSYSSVEDHLLEGQQGQRGYLTMNLLSVVPKEKPPLNVVGDVHGRIAIIVVSTCTCMSVRQQHVHACQ